MKPTGTAPQASTPPGAESAGHAVRLRPVLLYCAIGLAVAVAFRSAWVRLSEERRYTLDRQVNTMTWSAFLLESPFASGMEMMAIASHRNANAQPRDSDYDLSDMAPGPLQEERMAAVEKSMEVYRKAVGAGSILSLTLVDREGSYLAGTSEGVPKPEYLRRRMDGLERTRSGSPFVQWFVFGVWPVSPGVGRLKVFVPLNATTSRKIVGGYLIELKSTRFGTQERYPKGDPRNRTGRISTQFMRQAEARGLITQNPGTRTLLLSYPEGKTLMTNSGELFSGVIPDIGADVDVPGLKAALSTAIPGNKTPVVFISPAYGTLPECVCLLDVSSASRGYVTLVQSESAEVFSRWNANLRATLLFSGVILALVAGAMLVDLRRRRMRAALTIANAEVAIHAAREETALLANAELERRVAARTAELAGANEELGAFARTVSHDLRAPLRAIRGYVALLSQDFPEIKAGRFGEYFSRIDANASRMAQLIDDILRLSKVSHCAPVKSPVNLSELAAEVAAHLREVRPDHPVALDIAPGLVAEADPALVRIVLENLLGNAWKYSSRRTGAEVAFGVERKEGVDTYFIRDNGAGFPSDAAGELFKPFSRLHGDTEFEGTGLGLAIVARIIGLHGGEISAEGAPGRGAVFRFTLAPRAGAEPARS